LSASRLRLYTPRETFVIFLKVAGQAKLVSPKLKFWNSLVYFCVMAFKKTVLFFASFLFFAGLLPAQDDFKILLEFLPDSVKQNEAFTINLVVSHPNPEEVYVRPPAFNDSFRMERMRTEVRLVSDITRNSERFTVFEFLLIPYKVGLQEIGAFEVEVQGKTRSTAPMTVYVQAAEERFNARLVWLGRDGLRRADDSVGIGETYEVALRIVYGKNDSLRTGTFKVPVETRENAIVEEIPLSKNDSEEGIVLRLRIVPLYGKTVNIGAQSIEYGKTRIEIPALTVNVLPETKKFSAAESREVLGIEDEYTPVARQVKPVSFSGMMNDNKKIITVFRRGADRRIAEAERLWVRGKYAKALAVLRNGEMTLSAAKAVRRARTVCEDALRLPPGTDEPWLPRGPILFVLVLSAAAFTVLFFVRKRFYFSALHLSALLSAALLCASALFFSFFYEKNRAVSEYCAIYPIPEENVKPVSFLMEGEAVNIRSKSGSWFYVEGVEVGGREKSGWIKKENALIIARRAARHPDRAIQG
jgi:hypothetical protein